MCIVGMIHLFTVAIHVAKLLLHFSIFAREFPETSEKKAKKLAMENFVITL
jgi:hypothetical protein